MPDWMMLVVAVVAFSIALLMFVYSFKMKRLTGAFSSEWMLGLLLLFCGLIAASTYEMSTTSEYSVIRVTQYGDDYEVVLSNDETIYTDLVANVTSDDWTVTREHNSMIFGLYTYDVYTLNMPTVGMLVYDSKPTEEETTSE